jgi:ATP-dependent Clp protease ATP-binding subunit ClpB
MVDFRNTVIIMTSNVGSASIFQLAEKDPKRAHEEAMEALRAVFRPEFLNRVDDIIMFHPLGKDQIGKILNLQLAHVSALLAPRGITLKLSTSARDLLLREGYDPVYGARPLKRAIQRLVQDPLALRILDGQVHNGEIVSVEADPSGDKMKFRPEAAKVGAA